jgi:DNA helicase-2/ATP-dependent DNA helicase PcrA
MPKSMTEAGFSSTYNFIQKVIKNTENKGFSRLNQDQKKAVQSAPERPLLIVAGAGTGKTATLTQRVAFFIEEGIPGSAICAITFTNKAAREMEERITSLLREKGDLRKGGSPFIGTFHAFGARILRKHSNLLGRTPGFVIFDNHDSFSLIKKILKDLDKRKENPASMAGKVSDIKSSGGDISKESPFLQTVFTRYENSLQSQNAFDFDDLLAKVVLLFKKQPAVLAKYREQFTHILIDEYQDLNDVQYELVRLLVGDRTSISVVGDAEQTIYGWRGSNIEIFLRFPDDWAQAAMVTLTQNYRSTQNILLGASGVIAQNVYDTKVRRATDLWTENGAGKPIMIYETLDEDTEAMWVTEQIAKGISNQGYIDASTAVLYRTNAQSRAIEQALLRRRIPYRVYGGLKFYERREIKDIVAALRYSLNPEDEIARERLEKTFTKRLSKTLAAEFENNRDETPLSRIELFMKTVDYLAYVERHLTNPRERRENIEELIHFASGYKDIAQFLEEIALLQSTDNMANGKTERGETNVVSLMTVHLAKGLEFDRVFVIGCSEGLLPHARSIDTKLELQEERRLMYVAMTRARKELYLTFYGLPSRFLGEIPAEATEFKSALGNNVPLDFRDEEYEERYITLN